jgi:AcrR family transcriptional regulator
MGRHKTISDESLLETARGAFRERGFAVSGREIARLAGVSEAVLYQRFGSKDALFFAAMTPAEPDLARIFGPRGSEGDAQAWIRGTVDRMSVYFEELIPLALQVMLHPGSTETLAGEGGPGRWLERLEKELALRLRVLQKRGAITDAPCPAVARLLVGMAHDWALNRSFTSPGTPRNHRSPAAWVDVAWRGIAP